MNTSHSGSPGKGGELVTDSSDSVFVCFDGPGDTTPRPRRPNIPRDWPNRPPPQAPPDSPQTPDKT